MTENKKENIPMNFLGYEINLKDILYDIEYGHGSVTKIDESNYYLEVTFDNHEDYRLKTIESYSEEGVRSEHVNNKMQTLFWRDPKNCTNLEYASIPEKILNKNKIN